MDGDRVMELLRSLEAKYKALGQMYADGGSDRFAKDYTELAEALRTASGCVERSCGGI